MHTYRFHNLVTDNRFVIEADDFPAMLQPEWGFPDCEVTCDGEPFEVPVGD